MPKWLEACGKAKEGHAGVERVDDAKSQNIAGNWGSGSVLACSAVEIRDSGNRIKVIGREFYRQPSDWT